MYKVHKNLSKKKKSQQRIMANERNYESGSIEIDESRSDYSGGILMRQAA
jgi:hypothetical protein